MAKRYYFNISELLAVGQTINDVQVAVMYDQVYGGKQSTKVSGPFALDAANGIYYIQLDWAGIKFFGTRELHFALVAAQDSDYATHWDPSNDYSHEGITSSYTIAQRVPVYSNGVKVFGQEATVLPSASPGTSPSPTPTASPAIQVAYCCGETASSTTMIAPWVQVKNMGSAALDLSRVKLRYWYSEDRSQSYNFACDYVKVGSANITGQFYRLDRTASEANAYFELGFSSGAGKLNAGASTGDIKIRLYRANYTALWQSDDYSFDPLRVSTGENLKITGYIDGKLVYGVEP